MAILNKDFREKKLEDQSFGNGSIDFYQRKGNSWTFKDRLTPQDIRQLDPQQKQCNLEFPHQFSFEDQSLIVSCETAVYVFQQEAGKWVYRQKITGQDIPENLRTSDISKYFATQVIHRANTLIIRPERLSSFSSLRIFKRDPQDQRWKFKQALEGKSDTLSNPSFQRFAFDGETIFIGDPDSLPDGLVQTYQRNSRSVWESAEKILPGKIDRFGLIFGGDRGLLYDHYAFGGGVAVKGDYMIAQCRVEPGPFKRFSGEILLFKRESRSRDWKPIARFGTGRGGQGYRPTLWPSFSSIYLSDQFAAIVNTGDTKFDGQNVKHSHIINLYKLK
jgi:hypothetical protein